MVNNFLKKILLLTLFFSLIVLPQKVLAQEASTAPKNIILEKQKAIQNNTGLESWTNEAMGSNMVSLFIGLNGTTPEAVLNDDANFDNHSYLPGGAIGELNSAVVALYRPPASGIEYIAQVRDNLLGKPVYAQNSSINKLQYILPLWRIFRNIVYILSTILFIVIGMMIMLRVKVSPQAVITVQSAIPRIITVLILVTFSYAIAGLVLDLCNLFQAIATSLLFSAQNKGLTENLFEDTYWYKSGISGLWEKIKNLLGVDNPDFTYSSLVNLDSATTRDLAKRISPNVTTGYFLGLYIGRVTNLGAFLGGVGGVILPLLISIIKFFWLFKLFFNLLKCYATLLIKIIFAPLEIAMGAIPNSKINFSSWITDFAANALVFPVVALFLIVINVIIDVFVAGTTNQGLWMPSIIDGANLFHYKDRAYVAIATGLGLIGLSLLSKLPEMIPVMIKEMKGPDFGKAIGESLGGVLPGALGAINTGATTFNNSVKAYDSYQQKFGKTKATTPSNESEPTEAKDKRRTESQKDLEPDGRG